MVMLEERWYVELKNGIVEFFDSELDMYKFLYEETTPGTVLCYGKEN